jgi:uncharacterized protein involved in response to NO
MTTAQQQVPAPPASGFLSCGFRPFFLFAALWALLGTGIWILMLPGRLELPTAFDPVSWHAHEALFGYLGAVLAGFLLTAVPNWTGRPPLAGWPLLGLLALWLLGRVVVAGSAYLAPSAVAALDLFCLVVLGGIVLREIVAAQNWRNLVVIAIIGVFILGNGLFHWEAAQGEPAASGHGLRLGLAAAIMMISLVGGRIVPAFTRNWLAQRESKALPTEFGWLDRCALVLTLFALLAWVTVPARQETAYLLLGCGLAQAARLARWRGLDTGREPLVWILHLGYAFVPLGMLVMGVTILWPDPLPPASAQHLWMAGAIGVMTLAVMTRATLGHTGRELTVGGGTAALYLLVVASVFVRLLGGALPEQALSLWTLSAILWCCGFAGFVLLYGRLLVGSRQR